VPGAGQHPDGQQPPGGREHGRQAEIDQIVAALVEQGRCDAAQKGGPEAGGAAVAGQLGVNPLLVPLATQGALALSGGRFEIDLNNDGLAERTIRVTIDGQMRWVHLIVRPVPRNAQQALIIFAEVGDAGVGVLLLLTGLADVDAAIITFAGLPEGLIAPDRAGLLLALPVLANTLFKAGLTLAIAPNIRGWRAAWPLIASVAAAGLAIAAFLAA
jgi:hypothetical protein